MKSLSLDDGEKTFLFAGGRYVKVEIFLKMTHTVDGASTETLTTILVGMDE